MARERLGAFDVRVWSAGSDSPLLYLHGFEQHPGAASFLDALSRNHEVRAPEHPGFGESTGFEEFHDVIDVALYYRRMIESWNKDLKARPTVVIWVACTADVVAAMKFLR